MKGSEWIIVGEAPIPVRIRDDAFHASTLATPPTFL